jgi:hypothetical protein
MASAAIATSKADPSAHRSSVIDGRIQNRRRRRAANAARPAPAAAAETPESRPLVRSPRGKARKTSATVPHSRRPLGEMLKAPNQKLSVERRATLMYSP